MLRSAPWYGPLLYRFIFPVVRGKIRDSLGVTPEGAVQAKHQLEAAFAKLNQALAGKDFLVGDCFSRADLTACSLLETLCIPQQALPDALETFRKEHEQDRFFSWVIHTYQTYRREQNEA
jgi:glutathione S-transferase